MGESDERSDPLDEAARLFGHALEEWADGRPAQALQTCLDALAITERTLGPSLDTIGILNTLSGIRLDLSDYQGAFDASQRASAMVSMLVVDDDDTPVHAQVRIHTIATLARVERTLGRLEAAEQHYLEALTAAEAQAGVDDASLAPMLNDLAVVYKYAARYDEAVTLYRRALAAIETSLGPEHADAATVWHNLGGIEHSRGRHAEGESYARRSVQIREAALGPEHPAVAADIAALAALVQEQGRLDEADTLYRRALADRQSTVGQRSAAAAQRLLLEARHTRMLACGQPRRVVGFVGTDTACGAGLHHPSGDAAVGASQPPRRQGLSDQRTHPRLVVRLCGEQHP